MPVSQGQSNGLIGRTLKAWGSISSAGVLSGSGNVSGVTANAQFWRVTFTTPMAGTNYLVRGVANQHHSPAVANRAVGQCDIFALTNSGGTNLGDGIYFEVWE